MTDQEPPDEEPPDEPTRLEVLPETEPTSGETSEGIWVPTARGLFGELTDWQLVRHEVADQYDVRRWGRL